jgi:hypothetical protein
MAAGVADQGVSRMSIMRSLQRQWKPGDLLTAKEAAETLGYKSARQMTDPDRRARFNYPFTVVDIGGHPMFLSAEIDDFINSAVQHAKRLKK